MAAGEYIAFIDSDDWIDDKMYEVLYHTLLKYDADIAECSYRNLYADCIVEETACTGNVVEGDNILRWRQCLIGITLNPMRGISFISAV